MGMGSESARWERGNTENPVTSRTNDHKANKTEKNVEGEFFWPLFYCKSERYRVSTVESTKSLLMSNAEDESTYGTVEIF